MAVLRSRWRLSQSERERAIRGDQYFEKLIPILYFPWSTFIHWDVMQKSRGVNNPDFYQSQVLHTNVYRGLRGVTSSSGQGVLLTIYDPLLVTVVSTGLSMEHCQYQNSWLSVWTYFAEFVFVKFSNWLTRTVSRDNGRHVLFQASACVSLLTH